MKQKRLNKLIAMLVLFALMFSNFGYTIAAIATSDGFQVITNGFFKKDEIEFSAFFEEDEKKTDENISDVNNSMKLKLKISPKVEGYLKNANIKAVSASGSPINFKITGVEAITGEPEKVENESREDSNNEKNEISSEVVENTVETNEVVDSNVNIESNNETSTENTTVPETEVPIQSETTTPENEVEENEVKFEGTETNTVSTDTTNTVTEVPIQVEEETNTLQADEKSGEVVFSSSVSGTNTVAFEGMESEEKETSKQSDTESNQTENNQEINIPVQEETVPQLPAADPEEDILINEEQVIEEKVQEEKEELNLNSDIQIVADNEINIINVLKETTIIVDIEYVQKDNLNIEDLYKEIKLQLSGIYINVDLEEVAVAKEDTVYVGWKYNKDIEISSEYTKVSPFKIGDKQGTIVENKITVKRETQDENYLPLKSTTLEVIIPTFNGKMPIDVDIHATKLMATKGEDTGLTTFSKDNWIYDEENGKIIITVTNEENGVAKNTLGEDEYVIIYRFEDYTEEISSKLEKNLKVEVEQYSALENIVLTKEIKEGQEIDVNVGELITYSINSNQEKIQKAKIYANYNSADAIYETEFTSHVTVNILTSDMLENLKIDCSKEVYKDVNGYEFQADGIKYKKIKFNYSEIKDIVSKGGNIEIYNKNGELLYTLNSSLITKEEDCTINLNYVDGIVISVNNIAVNGNIDFEVTKVIQKCNYDKAAFKNFKQIESRITAEVKYANLEDRISLQEIGATKDFEESYTRANLYINKENLTTIQDNENVELKIELNNDKENSDLYINPSFELVFPKYVTEVNVESINLLYEDGLRVKDFETYTESDIVKMRIELEGIQTTFSESSATNGTNILVNVKIKVDDYTPSKEDQIKLYYCNEGVSNYESQTKWTISKLVPNGILKTTNGFDVALVNYQAPNGLVTINGISNYDGELSEVKSVRQGTTTVQVPTNSPSRISTMELLALNNTGNDCTDVVFLGRIPFKGNTDVVTNEDLKTTTNALMKDFIKEDILNSNMVEIYYSENERANKNHSDGSNGWRIAESVQDISKIRSFLIIVKGDFKAGSVLRFTYDFEIPENLPYEMSMAGSFGAYYNNNTDVAVVYQTSIADKVGLTTEAGPKVEAKLNVDIGDGATVGERRFLKYTLTVVNSGSVTAEGITIKNPLPKYGTFYKYTNENSVGNDNYILDERTELSWNVQKLEPGETKTFNYMVKTDEIPGMTEYWSNKLGYEIKQDEQGYYYEKVIDVEYVEKEVEIKVENNTPSLNKENNDTELKDEEIEETPEKDYIIEEVYKKEKIYLDPVPDVYVTNKAKIEVSNLAIASESNETKNLLKDSNFDIVVNTEWGPVLSIGSEFLYMSSIKNLTGKEQKNVMVECPLPNTVEYLGYEIYRTEHQDEYNANNIYYDEEKHSVYVLFDEIYADESVSAYIQAKVVRGNNEKLDNYFTVTTEDGTTEKSSIMSRLYAGPNLVVKQTTNLDGNTVKEGEKVELVISIENEGNYKAENVKIEDKISENLTYVKAKVTGSISDNININTDTLEYTINEIPAEGKVLITISGTAAKLNGVSKVISNFATINIKDVKTLQTNVVNITITENPELIAKEEEEKRQQEQNSTNYITGPDNNNSEKPSNNTSNNNNSNNSSNNSTNDGNYSKGDSSNNSQNNKDNQLSDDSVNNQVNGNTHSISGCVWLDANRNGRKEETEELVSAVIVQLSKDGNMIKATTTDGNGMYEFENLQNGNYVVTFKYDEEKYVGTSYKKSNVEEDLNSDAVQTSNGKAVTNKFKISDLSVENLNLGLQDKNIFDLSISKVITDAKLTIKGKSENYEYDNLKLAKLEIPSKKIDNSTVEIKYKIIIENIGNVSGKALSIIDYIPEDMKFDETKNTGWYLGKDGNIYNDTLKDDDIEVGEKRELELVLVKNMNGENTGVVSNKVEIAKTENSDGLKEDATNNKATQETIISIKTGGSPIVYTSVTIIGVIAVVGMYMITTKKVEIKTFYNNKKSKIKFNQKKMYK